MSKIEEIIVEIENYIENCKPAPFSGNRKIMVDKDDMQDLLVQLKMRTPDEIKKYQKIVSNKDAILANAKAQAEAIIEDAKKQKADIVNESDAKKEAEALAKNIIEEAEAKAKERVNEAQEYSRIVIDKANEEAEAVRIGAIEYTDSLLAHVQEVIVNALESYRNNYSDMVLALQSDYETIMSNRNELISEDSSSDIVNSSDED